MTLLKYCSRELPKTESTALDSFAATSKQYKNCCLGRPETVTMECAVFVSDAIPRRLE
jgi:hypothetical protein